MKKADPSAMRILIAAEIAAERQRQIDAEGWTKEHDDARPAEDLMAAALAYFDYATGRAALRPDGIPRQWPWDPKWWKPYGPRRDLVRAGALCLAHQERLVRGGHPQHLAPTYKKCVDEILHRDLMTLGHFAGAPICTSCGGYASRVIYLGLPGRFCTRCNLLEGPAAYAPAIAIETENGPRFSFLFYNGSYLKALWHWLTKRSYADDA